MPCKHASVLGKKNEYYCWLHCQHVVLPSGRVSVPSWRVIWVVSAAVSASFTRCWLFTLYNCLLASSEWSLLLVLVKIQVRVGMGVHEYMGECVTHITGMWWITFASGLLQMVSTKNLILIEYTELMHFFFKLWCQTSVRPLRLGMHMHFGGFSFIHYYIFYSFHLWYKLWFTWDDPVNEETPNST